MENQNQRNNEETEIDLVELFWVLWRKLPLMIAVGLFTALLAFGGSKFLMTPTYQSDLCPEQTGQQQHKCNLQRPAGRHAAG